MTYNYEMTRPNGTGVLATNNVGSLSINIAQDEDTDAFIELDWDEAEALARWILGQAPNQDPA